MGEICILHAADSREMACRMAARLAEEGHSVIRRDHDELAAGAGRLGAAADAVVAIWSPAVKAGSALLDDARQALARRVLAPVAIGGAEPPRSFAHLWPIDLDGWTGDENDPRWQFVRDEIDLARRRVEQREENASVAAAPAAASYRFIAPTAAFVAIAAAAAVIRLSSPAEATAVGEPPILAHFEPVETAMRDDAAFPEGADEVRPPAPQLRDASIASAERIIDIEPAADAAGPVDTTSSDQALAEREDVAPAADLVDAGVAVDDNPAATDGLEIAIETQADEIQAAAAVEFAPASPGGVGLVEGDAALQAPDDIAVDAVTPADDAEAAILLAPPAPDTYAGLVFRDCIDCPDMVEIPAGVAPAATAGGRARINPAPFALARREVTFAEWDICVADGGCAWRAPDDGWGRGEQPVINVSRADALSYAAWLSRRTGYDYRLPSEEEWEYATLGGGSDPRAEGGVLSPRFANYDAGALSRPAPTGRYTPSAYGLYDMLGNVWEWAADCDAAENGACLMGVAKGGAFDSEAWRLSASARIARAAAARAPDTGFRVARSLP